MDEPPGHPDRRRPRAPAPEPEEPPFPQYRTSGGQLAATRVAGVALAVVVVVVVVALVAGADVNDLPWGAIIGVLLLIGGIFIIGRRRRLPPE